MRYQNTKSSSKNNAFCWANGEVSIFSSDQKFLAAKTSGLSREQTSSAVISKKILEGKNPGTIEGLQFDKKTKPIISAEKVLAFRWGGAYSKAKGG